MWAACVAPALVQRSGRPASCRFVVPQTIEFLVVLSSSCLPLALLIDVDHNEKAEQKKKRQQQRPKDENHLDRLPRSDRIRAAFAVPPAAEDATRLHIRRDYTAHAARTRIKSKHPNRAEVA